jgi:hypothetical protein
LVSGSSHKEARYSLVLNLFVLFVHCVHLLVCLLVLLVHLVHLIVHHIIV